MDTIPKTKHCLYLYEGDYDRIRSLYPEVGAAVVIRKVIRDFIRKIESKDQLDNMEINLD